MSAVEIDDYLQRLDKSKQSTLSQLCRDILAVVPDAEQCISYGLPSFKIDGKTIVGLGAFRNHLSYLPHSGSVFPELANELAGYQKSSGSLRFPVDQPLPPELVEKLIAMRLRQAFPPKVLNPELGVRGRLGLATPPVNPCCRTACTA